MSISTFTLDFPKNPGAVWIVPEVFIDGTSNYGSTKGTSAIAPLTPILPSGIQWKLLSYQIIARMCIVMDHNGGVALAPAGKLGAFYCGLTAMGDLGQVPQLPKAPLALDALWTNDPDQNVDLPVGNDGTFQLPDRRPFVAQHEFSEPIDLSPFAASGIAAGLWLLPSVVMINTYIVCDEASCALTVEG